MLPNDLILKAPLDHQISTIIVARIWPDLHHLQVIGTPILLRLSIERPPRFEEPNHQTGLHSNDNGLEVPRQVGAVVPCLRSDRISLSTGKEETEAPRTESEAVGIKVAVLPDEGHLDVVVTAVGRIAVGQNSQGREDLDHQVMNGDSILHRMEDLVPLVGTTTATITATVDLTIDQAHDIPFSQTLDSPQHLTLQGATLQ